MPEFDTGTCILYHLFFARPHEEPTSTIGISVYLLGKTRKHLTTMEEQGVGRVKHPVDWIRSILD